MMANVVDGTGRNIACYETAIKALNGLQSNSTYINAANPQRARRNISVIHETTKYLLRSGLTWDQLNTLSIIHVAGTKGKGSTCAFIESILREHGCCTGLYTSPHLINVRERFKINGSSISELQFTHYFWKVYNLLDKQKESQSDMPQYFKFLTIMMFHVFLEANLDVAIVEVGIGGEYDCTNVIRNPVCTGITSLGLDHVKILGNTLEEIAHQKSGIFKDNVPAFTVPQPMEAQNVLEKRAIERNCELNVVQKLESYPWPNGVPKLGIQSEVQYYNASLAILLANCWASKNKLYLKNKYPTIPTYESNLSINIDKVSKALAKCIWLGRTQVMRGKMADFFLDGAHTIESLQNCAVWFEKETSESRGKKYLIFNVTKDRNSTKLLTVLKCFKFDGVYFVPNIVGCVKKVDQYNTSANSDLQITKLRDCRTFWGHGAEIAESVAEAFAIIASQEGVNEAKPNVLISGSLHLVGAALTILDPELTMKTDL